MLLDMTEDICVCGSVATAPELIAICTESQPDAVVFEVDVPAAESLALLSARLRRVRNGLRLIGVSAAAPTRSERDAAGRSGITTIVARHDGIVGILAALRGQAPTSNTTVVTPLQHSLPWAPSAVLTPRETEVLTWVGAGYTTREVAHQLHISHKTVENHKQRLFGKLGVQSQAHAVSMAFRSGLLRPESMADLAVVD